MRITRPSPAITHGCDQIVVAHVEVVGNAAEVLILAIIVGRAGIRYFGRPRVSTVIAECILIQTIFDFSRNAFLHRAEEVVCGDDKQLIIQDKLAVAIPDFALNKAIAAGIDEFGIIFNTAEDIQIIERDILATAAAVLQACLVGPL